MSSPRNIKILLVGDDLRLLRRRVPPLVAIGAEVVISHPHELETHVGNERFDLAVLCYTLSDVARRTATEHAHRRWPRIKLLQIFRHADDVASIGCPLDAHVLDVPDELAVQAQALISRAA